MQFLRKCKQNVIRKCMISLIWGVAGIQSLLAVPKEMKYKTEFLCQQLISDLKSNIWSETRWRTVKDHWIRLDTAHAHNSQSFNEYLEATNPQRVLHPACSPDLTLSNFFLFGFLKEKFRRIAHPDDEDLISHGQVIFDEIPESVLILVHMTWIKRFRWVIKNKCEYYSKQKRKLDFDKTQKAVSKVTDFSSSLQISENVKFRAFLIAWTILRFDAEVGMPFAESPSYHLLKCLSEAMQKFGTESVIMVWKAWE
jgi:hypothetical protein